MTPLTAADRPPVRAAQLALLLGCMLMVLLARAGVLPGGPLDLGGDGEGEDWEEGEGEVAAADAAAAGGGGEGGDEGAAGLQNLQEINPGETEGAGGAAPRTIITKAPAKLSNDTKPLMAFKSNRRDSTFVVRLDSSDWLPAVSPIRFKQTLADGLHVFRVMALSPGGAKELNPPLVKWVIDSTPPQLALMEAPAPLGNRRDAAFAFSANEKGCSFWFTLGFTPKGGPAAAAGEKGYGEATLDVEAAPHMRLTVSELLEGEHRLVLWGKDKAGNHAERPLEHVWRIDMSPPRTRIRAGPPKLAKEADATFTLEVDETSDPKLRFEYRLNRHLGHGWQGSTAYRDGDAFALHLHNLPSGPQTIEIRAVDSAGNTDLNPPKFKWTIHGGTPQSSIVHGPGPRTNARNQTFVITSSETQFTYAYRLDNGQVVRPAGHHFISGNATFVVANLKEGNHAIQVRTASVLGIEDPTPVQQLWFVDLTPPKVHVIQRPPKKSADPTAKFVIDCSEPYFFSYRVNGGRWFGEDSTQVRNAETAFILKSLKEGKYSLELKVRDGVGNARLVDPIDWIVDTGPPETKLVHQPEPHSKSRRPRFILQCSERDCTYEFRLDRGGWTKAHSKHAAAIAHFEYDRSQRIFVDSSVASLTLAVQPGFHSISFRAADAAGSVDASGTKDFEWVVF